MRPPEWLPPGLAAYIHLKDRERDSSMSPRHDERDAWVLRDCRIRLNLLIGKKMSTWSKIEIYARLCKSLESSTSVILRWSETTIKGTFEKYFYRQRYMKDDI